MISMKPGQRFFCQRCHSTSIAKLERRMDGFTVVEEYLACAFCHARIPEETDSTEEKAPKAANPSLSALENLLGAKKPSMDKTQAAFLDELHTAAKRFCRDCRHYVKHPFGGRCALTGKNVEPMDDCPRFEKRVNADESPNEKD